MCSYIFTQVASYSYFGPSGIALADFDLDSNLDMVVSSTSANNVRVFLGNGTGSFSSSASYSTGYSSYPRAIALGDFNKDNELDMVVADYSAGNIAILLGSNGGNFSAATFCSVGANPYGVAVGDVNNDTCSDIAVASLGSNNVVILLGNCSGTFGASGTVKTFSTGAGSNPCFVALADLNSDGRLDIAVANHLSNTVGIFIGYGNGNFSAQTTYSTGSGTSPNMITIADFNQDTYLDIVVVNSFSSSSGIFFGYGNGLFSTQTTVATTYSSIAVTTADINNDNLPDLICTHYSVGSFGILLGDGNGTFEAEILTTLSSGGPFGIACGDFNGDNKQDIAITNGLSGTVQIFLNPC